MSSCFLEPFFLKLGAFDEDLFIFFEDRMMFNRSVGVAFVI